MHTWQLKIVDTESKRHQTLTALSHEIKSEFPEYLHQEISFRDMLEALVGSNENLLDESHFKAELKYNIKLFSNFFDLIAQKKLIGDLKKSIVPLLLSGMENPGGNRTQIKLLIFAIFLSPKSLPSISRTYGLLAQVPRNQDPLFIFEEYKNLTKKLRRFRSLKSEIKDPASRAGLLRKGQIQFQEELHKNWLWARLGLPPETRELDDPYRPFPLYDGNGALLNRMELWKHSPWHYHREILASPQ